MYNSHSASDALVDIRSLPTEREAGLAQNKSLAEWNLAQEPKLNQLRLQLPLYGQKIWLLDEVSSGKSIDTTSNLLQVAAQEADDEAENTTKSFLAGTIPAEQFLKDLLEKKTLAHLRKIKSDRLIAILREQQYAQPAPPVPPRNTAPYPDLPAPGRRIIQMLAKCRPVLSNLSRRFASLREMAGPQDPELLYEPKFPDTREYPEYDLLNVRIQGHDFTYIEKFQGYVDRMARRFNFKVVDSYAVAAQTQRVVTYKPNSTIVDNEMKLSLYDRVVRIGNVPAPQLQLFITLIQTHLPVGVTVTVKQHEKTDEDYRYIPDILLKQKQEELKALDDPIIALLSRAVFSWIRRCSVRTMSMEATERLFPYDLVDIGANLGHPHFKDDLNDVLDRAKRAGVSKLMITGTCEKISKEAMELAETMPGFLYFTAGVHPHDAKGFDENSLNTLKSLQAHDQCVAVGECGLDFNRNFSPQDVQKVVFAKQVALACELQKPLFIHEREAHEDMVKILAEAGTEDEAKKYVEMGLYIGLTGFLWKDRLPNGVQVALRNGSIPLERLVIETDAPFMYPKINDKKLPADFASFNRNEPCSLAATCEMIAAFMGRNVKEVGVSFLLLFLHFVSLCDSSFSLFVHRII
ncbi:unnamed protein product [Nippostrongylus brasiliensis]|uniref:Deoxyribonuclease TATDN1 n=1 Tax=Nippostrongylus brasiliensis TaxID=27835 RepID=A0A0N4YKL1_NIPBR|nr:unnamed protein product [Nippostrongylus brasiliensis]